MSSECKTCNGKKIIYLNVHKVIEKGVGTVRKQDCPDCTKPKCATCNDTKKISITYDSPYVGITSEERECPDCTKPKREYELVSRFMKIELL